MFVATSARSLPALLRAELGYKVMLHCGYLDPTTQTTNNTSATSTAHARLLSLCSCGRSLELGLNQGRAPRFQRGQ